MTTTASPPGTPGVLRTRLQPPRLPPDCVARQALVDRVLRGLQGRIVSVVAPAGFGKTTLLAEAQRASDLRWVWLSCDARIRTPEMLIAHLAAGLAEAFPGVGAGLAPDPEPEAQVAAIANEIELTIPDDFVMAFDDVHSLEDEAVVATLSGLARDLPPKVHLVLASRRSLRIPLARVSAGGSTQIGADQLAFSFDEAVQLLGDDLDETSIGQVHERTEGWVSGLLLMTRAGGGDPSGRELPTGPHFDYLAEEVVDSLPADRQRLLLDLAVLDRFSPELAALVTGRGDARAEIAELLASHLFVTRIDEEREWYRFHHLFQAFLRRRLQERESDRLTALHLAAGEAWLALGEPEEAVGHFLDAGAPERAADAMEPIAEAMAATSERPTLDAWFDRIPEPVWTRRPGLRLAYALLQYLSRRPDRAFAAWPEAIEQLVQEGDHVRAADALYTFQLGMLTAGVRPSLRVEAGRRFIPRLTDAGPAMAITHMLQGLALSHACRIDEAEVEIDLALERCGPAQLALMKPCADMLRGYILYPRGELGPALRMVDEGLARIEAIEDRSASMIRALGIGFRAVIFADVGRYRDCLGEAEALMDLSESLGMRPSTDRLGLWWRLIAHTGLGDREALVALAAVAARVSPDGGTTNFAFRYSPFCARAATLEGDRERARSYIEIGREELRAFGDSHDGPMALAELALAARANGDEALFAELADECRDDAARLGLDWHRARGALLGAVAHGPGAIGDARLDEALTLTETRDLEVLWTRRQRDVAGPLLARAMVAGLGPKGTAARLAAACGREVLHHCTEQLASAPPEARAALADAVDDRTDIDAETVRLLLADADGPVVTAMARVRALLETRPRPVIRIGSFGGLRLYRAGQRVPDAAFGRPKARVLLAALTCAGDAGAHRDRLLEDLWHDLPPERGARALDTTLHELRRTLEPLTTARSGSSLIAKEGEVYRLQLGERDSWDAGEFLRLAAAGGDRNGDDLDRLLRAERLWSGEFLPEFPYEDWASRTRERLEGARIDLLERLAAALAANGRPAAAIERYRALLRHDPEREGWHRALMRSFAAAGERPMALRQFHACRAVLRQRLGIEPSPETRALYTQLL